jgi:hypothetical protein
MFRKFMSVHEVPVLYIKFGVWCAVSALRVIGAHALLRNKF